MADIETAARRGDLKVFQTADAEITADRLRNGDHLAVAIGSNEAAVAVSRIIDTIIQPVAAELAAEGKLRGIVHDLNLVCFRATGINDQIGDIAAQAKIDGNVAGNRLRRPDVSSPVVLRRVSLRTDLAIIIALAPLAGQMAQPQRRVDTGNRQLAAFRVHHIGNMVCSQRDIAAHGLRRADRAAIAQPLIEDVGHAGEVHGFRVMTKMGHRHNRTVCGNHQFVSRQSHIAGNVVAERDVAAIAGFPAIRRRAIGFTATLAAGVFHPQTVAEFRDCHAAGPVTTLDTDSAFRGVSGYRDIANDPGSIHCRAIGIFINADVPAIGVVAKEVDIDSTGIPEPVAGSVRHTAKGPVGTLDRIADCLTGIGRSRFDFSRSRSPSKVTLRLYSSRICGIEIGLFRRRHAILVLPRHSERCHRIVDEPFGIPPVDIGHIDISLAGNLDKGLENGLRGRSSIAGGRVDTIIQGGLELLAETAAP